MNTNPQNTYLFIKYENLDAFSRLTQWEYKIRYVQWTIWYRISYWTNFKQNSYIKNKSMKMLVLIANRLYLLYSLCPTVKSRRDSFGRRFLWMDLSNFSEKAKYKCFQINMNRQPRFLNFGKDSGGTSRGLINFLSWISSLVFH